MQVNYLTIIIFYSIVAILIFISYKNNKAKNKLAFKEALKSSKELALIFVLVLILMVFLGTIFSSNYIIKYINQFNGIKGILFAALAGSIIHIPAFLAFPLGGQILKSGVNPGIIAVLINTLIMVHTFTIPIEIKSMGWKYAIIRNGFSLISAIIIGIIIGGLY